MPLDEMIAGQAFASQQRVFSTRAAQDDPVHAADYQAYGAVAILAAPITAGQIRLGVLSMYGPPASH